MVNRNLMRQFDLEETELAQQLQTIFDRPDVGKNVDDWYEDERGDFEVNRIIQGRVANIVGDNVLIGVPP